MSIHTRRPNSVNASLKRENPIILMSSGLIYKIQVKIHFTTGIQMDIPAPLRAHARRRSLVVMAGAGVSAGPPTSLPSWHQLNKLIVAALCERLERYQEK